MDLEFKLEQHKDLIKELEHSLLWELLLWAVKQEEERQWQLLRQAVRKGQLSGASEAEGALSTLDFVRKIPAKLKAAIKENEDGNKD